MNRQNGNTKITALYSRLSRDDEAIGDSLSIVNQKAMLEKYAAQNGFFNVVHFSDDGYSGGNFDRPDWKRLIAEIEKGNVTTVIAKDDKCKQRIKILCEFFRSRRKRELDKGKARHHAVGYRAFLYSML
jgi:DNA invertase Pin-like site-specific DNA recombinase